MPVMEPKAESKIPPELADHPRYRVQSQLGAGGMGVVYKAEHVLMGRTVAVKVMAQRYTANAVAVERFRREVRAAAKLAHPNIVTAYDADEADGRHFLVMEFVDGVSLDRVVNRRGPLPVTTACHVVRMAALGLQHAHSKGMVHRDIKPQNVMVNRTSQVKVLDFGLARLASDGELPAGGEPGGSHNPAVTNANTIVGTPDYISPEQAKAAAVDHRSDLYSLGCLFYFALTGRPPFADATTAIAKVTAHVIDQPPPVTAYRNDIPPELAAVLAKLLAKNPAERYSSAAKVAAALIPFTKASQPTPSLTITPVPRIEAFPVADFGFADDPAAETLVATPPPTKKLRTDRRHRGWHFSLGFSALIAGTLILLLLLISALNSDKRDAQPTANTPGGNPVQGKVAAAGAGPAARVAPVVTARVLFVLPKRGLYLDDYEPVRARLTELGAKVTTAARQRGPCEISGGNARPPVTAELSLADVKPDDYDAILFPGYDVGDFIRPGEVHTQLERIVRPMAEAKKVIGGICVGQRVLLRFQLLRQRQAAQPEYEVHHFLDKSNGVNWMPWKRVVTDGNIVTASSANDARDFAEAVHAAVVVREGK
ncbi:protein kinase domain-containing protein [Limnoglobus roseus]|uniref:non-specific serine/threonine protein kinase n=1 Tax=Limnoglobus roseus TaxID=2598579 RepID=A0A5C1AAU9_9BACT|nr:protein kinase [Limnoglobus roseus]QEL16509.1 protein kinase [Limnoglobus roseus]